MLAKYFPPFLKIGITFACIQSVRTSPLDKDVLNMVVRRGANSYYPSMPEITVTANGIEKLLSKLDPSKATGPDEISSRILKQYAHEFQ
jgi:hypothetical protein